MANTLHSTLTGSDLHECKGAASASLGTVMRANGDGTATFQSLAYTYITGKPTLIFNGTTLTTVPIVAHYQVTASGGVFTQAISGFTTIHSVQVTAVNSGGTYATTALAGLTSVSTSSISGTVVVNGALGTTQQVYLTVHGV